MKTLYQACIFGLIVSASSAAVNAALAKPTSLIGKFLVSSTKGDVTCISEGRILELKKGDTFTARGCIVRTGEGSHVTIVFSNGTGVYTDEKTNFEVVKFDQEFFTPNNDLRVEPSNSSTVVKLNTGRVVISTPRLVSGTTMVYQTPHAAVGIRGEKILVECSEEQTHVAIVDGLANVNVRDKDGVFVSIGKRLTTGKEAFVKRVINGSTDKNVATIEETADKPDREVPLPGRPNSAAPAAKIVFRGEPLKPVISEGEAVVLRVTGEPALAKLPGVAQEIAVASGTKLRRGTVLSTGNGSQIDLQPFPGAVATLLPRSSLFIENLSVTSLGTAIKQQTALLALKSGSVVSTIDPAKQDVNDYSIRTPKGIAAARGTSFTVSVDGESFSVATTADVVSFTIPDGTVYSISAGNVSISPPGSNPQSPIPLAAAIASNPEIGKMLRTAFTTVASLVQSNTGGFSAESGTNLLVKVAAVAASALPNEAASIATAAVIAISAPNAATVSAVPAAIAAVTQAIVAAVPNQAVQVASAAATAAPSLVTTIAAAAAKESPTQSPQIAVAMALLFAQTDAQGLVVPASIQTAAAITAAVATAAPNQAPPVASAVLQALAQLAPKAPAAENAVIAATIAAAATTSVPDQAAPIASATMKALAQTATFANATPQVVAQSAATLAAAVTSVVPAQAQPVATAVMQLLLDVTPNATPAVVAELSGTLASAVAQVAPDQSAAVFAGVAGASGQDVASLQAQASKFESQAKSAVQQAGGVNATALAASQEGAAAHQALAAGVLLAQDQNSGSKIQGALNEGDSATSIIITQFDPTEINQLTSGLGAAETAQSQVQFTTGPDRGNGFSVFPIFVTPANPPPDFVASPARR